MDPCVAARRAQIAVTVTEQSSLAGDGATYCNRGNAWTCSGMSRRPFCPKVLLRYLWCRADTIIGGVGISWVVTAHTHTELGSSQQQFSPFSTSPRPQTQSRAAQQLGPPAPQGCRKLPSTVHTLFLFWGPNHHEV